MLSGSGAASSINKKQQSNWACLFCAFSALALCRQQDEPAHHHGRIQGVQQPRIAQALPTVPRGQALSA